MPSVLYYRQHKTKKRFFNFRNLLIASIIAFIAGGLIYLIVFSAFFRIKEISLTGAATFSKEDIERAVKEYLNKKILFLSLEANFFTLSEKKLIPNLYKAFPQIKSIEINRKFPNSLGIQITEREEIGVWCYKEENCFYIDENGVIFKYAPNFSSSLFLIIKDFSDKKIQLGDKVLDEKIINDLIDLRNKINTEADFKIYEFIFSPDLKALTSEGWQIYFDLSGNLKKQTDDLFLILKKEIKPEQRNNLEYIDLRINGRAYYKIKN